MKYKKDYYGFVYLWFDTKRKRFIIGSHHGSTQDGYTTSTGGKHVKNIFNARPETMKRRIISYTLVDDIKLTKQSEQRFLDLRPNIYDNKNYYNLNNSASGGIGGWDHINDDPDRVNPMSLPEVREHHRMRMKELSQIDKYHFGTALLTNNPMKDPTMLAKHTGVFSTTNNPLNDPEIALKHKLLLQEKLGRVVIIQDQEYPSVGEAARSLGMSTQKLRHRLKVPTFPEYYYRGGET